MQAEETWEAAFSTVGEKLAGEKTPAGTHGTQGRAQLPRGRGDPEDPGAKGEHDREREEFKEG